jgi:hypothetical protein
MTSRRVNTIFTYFTQTAKRRRVDGFEGESENDDDVPVYDSDNDPAAEKFVPLDENYCHDEIFEGEEDIGSFVTQEGMSDSEDESFVLESCPSPSSGIEERDTPSPTRESVFEGSTTDGETGRGIPSPDPVSEDDSSLSDFEFEQIESEEAYFDEY